jgi:hypothetical protein
MLQILHAQHLMFLSYCNKNVESEFRLYTFCVLFYVLQRNCHNTCIFSEDLLPFIISGSSCSVTVMLLLPQKLVRLSYCCY